MNQYPQGQYPNPQYPNQGYPQGGGGYGPPGPPPKKGMATWLVVLIAFLGGGVFLIGVGSVIAIASVRKYIANAKTVEARMSLAQIGKDTAEAYAREFHTEPVLCGSASHPVPSEPPHAAKYQSSPSDWNVDAKAHRGFACIRFSLEQPQYYSYNYVSSGDAMTASAIGDLDGDNILSTFTLKGHIVGTGVVLDTKLDETNPGE